MNTEAERTYTRRENRDTQDSSDDSYSSKYDFEIKLVKWKKILIIILNIFTGGLGTLIEPFLIEKKRLIFSSNCIIFLPNFTFLTWLFFIK